MDYFFITILIFFLIILVSLIFSPSEKSEKTTIKPQKKEKIFSILEHTDSEFYYTGYVVNPRKGLKPFKFFEGNKIGELGYFIYSEFIDKLHIVDVYIVDKSEKRIMKIDVNSDTESMIGVDDPIHGHIGFLPFSIVEMLS
ncbi:hypothetical protein C3K47_08750 [Solitalea longa]|uniref:Uncharacterized protein n=1 Tax=Solitalea longa TaxID=2079460 RepID=A0A2S5A3M4_9SPHI|nr:hypothetical protein [Solitalea longa]POY37136.1 hypothetical protein C3K47_08750 [Solitalea longa]